MSVQEEIDARIKHLKREVKNTKNGNDYIDAIIDSTIHYICHLKDTQNED